MNKDNQEFVNSLLQRLAKLNYIKPGDVPNIDLYMDQVTTFMDEHLSDVKRYEDDKILTKTMINNYTKNDLLSVPFPYCIFHYIYIPDLEVLLY
jgi:hypothetical protein